MNQNTPKNTITYHLLFWFALAHQFILFLVGGVIIFALAH